MMETRHRMAQVAEPLTFWNEYLRLQAEYRRKRARPARLGDALTSVLCEGFAVVHDYATKSQVACYRNSLPPVREYQHTTEGTKARFVARAAEIKALAPFFTDPYIKRLATAVIGPQAHQLRTIAQHRSHLGKTGGFDQFFHSDTWRPRFKAFLYLTDVGPANGPLVYLPRSHYGTWRWPIDWEVFRTFTPGSDGYIHDEISAFTGCLWPHQAAAAGRRLGRRPVELTGTAGTLILWDARGFHRIKEMAEGTRDILNSYWIDQGRHV